VNHVGSLGGLPQQAEQSLLQEPPPMRVTLKGGHAFQTEALAYLLVAIAHAIRNDRRRRQPGSAADGLSRFFLFEGP
jgi:hypothetical protein